MGERSAEPTIRAAGPQDANAVVDVWLASTIPGQPFIAEAEWRAQETEVRRDLLPAAQTWVAEHDGEIVAFVSVIDDVIGGLFTRPEHQGEGCGAALIARAKRGRDRLFVEVFEVNTGAVGFYRRRGFVDHARTFDERFGRWTLLLRMDRADIGGVI